MGGMQLTLGEKCISLEKEKSTQRYMAFVQLNRRTGHNGGAAWALMAAQKDRGR